MPRINAWLPRCVTPSSLRPLSFLFCEGVGYARQVFAAS